MAVINQCALFIKIMQVMLSNGDLVMDATSSDSVGLYECVAVFSTAGYRNVTLARYNVTSSEPHSAGMYILLAVERGVDMSVTVLCTMYAHWIH
jgi:hypothetical protein